jgi:hypothetical protein
MVVLPAILLLTFSSFRDARQLRADPEKELAVFQLPGSTLRVAPE